MSTELTPIEIKKEFNKLMNPKIRNSNVLESLNDYQIDQVYEYAKQIHKHSMDLIIAGIDQRNTTCTYENLYQSLNVESYVNIIKMIENHINNLQEKEGPQSEPPPNNKLSDLITHSKKIEIVEAIKIKYKNIKGKRLKLLLLAFQKLGLLPNERINQKFHGCCKAEFNWNIASYNAMNGYIFNDVTDDKEFEKMQQYINSILQ